MQHTHCSVAKCGEDGVRPIVEEIPTITIYYVGNLNRPKRRKGIAVFSLLQQIFIICRPQNRPSCYTPSNEREKGGGLYHLVTTKLASHHMHSIFRKCTHVEIVSPSLRPYSSLICRHVHVLLPKTIYLVH